MLPIRTHSWCGFPPSCLPNIPRSPGGKLSPKQSGPIKNQHQTQTVVSFWALGGKLNRWECTHTRYGWRADRVRRAAWQMRSTDKWWPPPRCGRKDARKLHPLWSAAKRIIMRFRSIQQNHQRTINHTGGNEGKNSWKICSVPLRNKQGPQRHRAPNGCVCFRKLVPPKPPNLDQSVASGPSEHVLMMFDDGDETGRGPFFVRGISIRIVSSPFFVSKIDKMINDIDRRCTCCVRESKTVSSPCGACGWYGVS